MGEFEVYCSFGIFRHDNVGFSEQAAKLTKRHYTVVNEDSIIKCQIAGVFGNMFNFGIQRLLLLDENLKAASTNRFHFGNSRVGASQRLKDLQKQTRSPRRLANS